MATLLDKMFPKVYHYLSNKSISVVEALKLVDISLLNLEVNCNDNGEYTDYLDNFNELNKLLKAFFQLTTDEESIFTDKSISYLSNLTKKRSENLARFIQKRLDIYNKYEPELVDLLSKLKEESTLKVA